MNSFLFKSLLFNIVFVLLINQNPLKAQDSVLVVNLQKHVSYLASDSLEGRGLGTKGAELAKEYIVDEFRTVGLMPFKGSFVHPFTLKFSLARVFANNIMGMIEGSDSLLKNEFIVLGAHYDHLGWLDDKGEKIIYNGADDNASGVSGIIELSRMFKENNIQFRRSILFIAFDAEKSGLLGSENIFKYGLLKADEVKCMFSLDMIGMYDKNEGLELNGFESLSNAANFVEQSLKEKAINIKKLNGKIERRTDTAPFGRNGIPATHVFTGKKSPYQRPEDDAALLDYEGMADVVEFMFVLTQKIANEDKLKASSKVLAFQNKYEKDPAKISFGLRLNTGISNHSYSNALRSKNVYAGQTGLFVRARLNEFISIQPELLYALGGSQSEKGVIRTHALSVPVNFVLGSSDLHEGRFYLSTGAYYNYVIKGAIGDEKLSFTDDYKHHILGFTLGVGVELLNMQLGVLLNNGLSNIGLKNNSKNNFGKTFEDGLSFSMGYKF